MRSKLSRMASRQERAHSAPRRSGSDREFKTKDCTVPMIIPPACEGWKVVQVSPQQSGRAIDGLKRGGYHVWRPRLTTWITSARLRLRSKVNRALFPSYLFAAPDRPTCAMLQVMEVTRIIGDVPSRMVHDLARRESEGEFDGTTAPPERERIPVGTPVVITGGPFAGFEGIISKSDQDRDQVLMEMCGRLTKVDVDAGHVSVSQKAV